MIKEGLEKVESNILNSVQKIIQEELQKQQQDPSYEDTDVDTELEEEEVKTETKAPSSPPTTVPIASQKKEMEEKSSSPPIELDTDDLFEEALVSSLRRKLFPNKKGRFSQSDKRRLDEAYESVKKRIKSS